MSRQKLFERWSNNILLVTLLQKKVEAEVKALVSAVKNDPKDIAIDFSEICSLTDSSLAKLQELKKTLVELDCRLIFCSVDEQITRALKIDWINIAKDKFSAIFLLETT